MKILIADDSPLLAPILKSVFVENGFEVLGTVNDFQSLVDRLKLISPDVLLVDMNMPTARGEAHVTLAQWHERITRAFSGKLIVLSSSSQEPIINMAIEHLKVDGYIVKDDPEACPKKMPDLIKKAVQSDRIMLSQKALLCSRKIRPQELGRLTEKQIALMSYMYLHPDASKEDVAIKFEVSLDTVKTHLKNVRAVLAVSNHTAAIIRMRDSGLIPVGV